MTSEQIGDMVDRISGFVEAENAGKQWILITEIDGGESCVFASDNNINILAILEQLCETIRKNKQYGNK